MVLHKYSSFSSDYYLFSRQKSPQQIEKDQRSSRISNAYAGNNKKYIPEILITSITMLHEVLYKHLDGILVSRLYTEDQFVDLFSRTIPESNTVIASQLYKSYEENDQRIIEKIDKLIDNKLSLIRVELEREQIEDSISLEEVNKLLHSIDDMLQQHLNQLNIELDNKNTKLLKYAMELSDIEAIDTSMYDNVAKLITDMETNQPSS